MPFDGYIRVSRVQGREGPSYISPSVQREAIARWAQYRGVEIERWHVDEDESGGSQERPGLREAMRRVEGGETQGIAFARLNRFARNVAGAINDIKRIKAAGGELVFVEEGIDGQGPFGDFLLTVLLAVATLERENIAAGWEVAKGRAIGRGAHIGRTPLGYERGGDGVLVPNGDAAHVVEAYRLAATRGPQAAHDYLSVHLPGRHWTLSTVRRLLAQRVYRGEVRQGALVNVDAHKPLVSEAVFKLAQSGRQQRRPAADFPLSGVARCGTCGNAMVGGRGGRGERTYRCSATLSKYYRGERCTKGAQILAETFERHVLATVQPLLEGLVAEGSEGTDGLVLAERGMLNAEAELEAFAADLTIRRALGASYHRHLEARVAALEKARREYQALHQASSGRRRIAASEVIDVAKLGELLRSIGISVLVRAGRGDLEERVSLVADHHPRD